jgi:hypothetical protein
MIHGRDPDLLVAAEVTAQVEHPGARDTLARLLSAGDRVAMAPQVLAAFTQGVRDLVIELCCALHNFRVRLTPWQPMV